MGGDVIRKRQLRDAYPYNYILMYPASHHIKGAFPKSQKTKKWHNMFHLELKVYIDFTPTLAGRDIGQGLSLKLASGLCVHLYYKYIGYIFYNPNAVWRASWVNLWLILVILLCE